ncbi:hypothetical protein ACFO4P_03855 [Epilithonimonas pallida]|uniref:LPXTG cell wall anchor domain-containing protein n=1 Tax=Epilithonimonas pallida TaxID=373671 RepID=A0ABY1R0J1_9FLAO|nr:hypothetical protein [Epilithonimonas pallida]SMP90759.1 hypothetical protein SAMN05421679_102426 [Epilithonimonas pallida]
MKNTKFYNCAKFFLFSILSMFTYTLSFAQDSLVTKTTNVTTRTEEWQTNPLYWVIGGVILIIIIAIIASRGRRKDD